MDFEPTFSPYFSIYIYGLLLDYRLDPGVVLESCDISTDPRREYIPISKMARLYEHVARLVQDDYLGLNIARNFRYESAGIVILAMLAANTVEENIRCLCRYDKHIDSAIDSCFKTSKDVAEFEVGFVDPKNANLEQLAEFLLSLFVDIQEKATREKMPVREVWFVHETQKDALPLEQFFGARVKFGQPANKVCFDRTYLKKKLFAANEFQFEALCNALKARSLSKNRENGFIDVVSREILQQVPQGTSTLSSVAEKLAISGRTLSRRLAEEGLNFQDVKKRARQERAKFYLQNTSMPLSEISYKLGYSELSAFSRAFRSWKGVSPQQFRETSIDEAGD